MMLLYELKSIIHSDFRARFLRNMDREENKQYYPHLHYPEIYILHGGYKNFFETQKVNINHHS